MIQRTNRERAGNEQRAKRKKKERAGEERDRAKRRDRLERICASLSGTDIHGVEDPCRHGLAADPQL